MAVKLSVIIPTCNRIQKLKRCLGNILSQEFDKRKYEIIVINDGSSDKTVSIILNFIKKQKNIKIISNKINKGPAYCRNQGIKEAKGKIIAFTDDDCVAHKGWLKQIEISHKKNPDELGIGGQIKSLESNKLISKFRDFQMSYLLKRNLVKENHFIYIPTCNVSYKKETFKRIGCFDDNLRFSEDLDLNIKLLKINKPILFNKNIIVFHDYENSIKDFIKKSYSYGLFIYLIKKRYPEIKLTVPISFFSTIIFLFAPFISIPLKFFSVKEFIKKIEILPLIILDEVAYRLGVIKGLCTKYNLK